MNKFKIGDKVRIISDTKGCKSDLRINDVGVIESFYYYNDKPKSAHMECDGDSESCFHDLNYIELVTPKPTPHIHHKEIIAWGNGYEIEFWNVDAWSMASTPSWRLCIKYRVKPTKTPTQIAIGGKEIELVKLKQQDLVERGIAEVLK